MFFGALFGVEYSSKELKCIVYNGVYELMKRRVISETYEATPADDIMDDIAEAASLLNPVGSCPSTSLVMEFDQTLCFDAMLEVAKACNCSATKTSRTRCCTSNSPRSFSRMNSTTSLK